MNRLLLLALALMLVCAGAAMAGKLFSSGPAPSSLSTIEPGDAADAQKKQFDQAMHNLTDVE